MADRCWLFKSEPDEFGIGDLAAAPGQQVRWDGIRNYQARNFIRDDIARGDRVFFYHSSCRVTGIAGICQVVSAPYPDPTQFDRDSDYFDAKSDPGQPRWYAVDIRLEETFDRVVTNKTLRACPDLENMVLFKNPRLSIQPVSSEQWRVIATLASQTVLAPSCRD